MFPGLVIWKDTSYMHIKTKWSMNHAAFMATMQLLVNYWRAKGELKNTVSMYCGSNTEKVVVSHLWVSKKRLSLMK